MSDRKRDRVLPFYSPPDGRPGGSRDANGAGITDVPSTALVPHGDRQLVTVQHVQHGTVDRQVTLLRARESKRAAAFRLARQRLLERDNIQVVLVTSPSPGEGKTAAAANLALAFAELGRYRILLVDGNLRRPGLARLLGITPPRCFFSQLQLHRDHPEQSWAVMKVADAGIHVLAVNPFACTYCGRPVVENGRFCGFCGRKLVERTMDGPAFRAAIERLRPEFDRIFVDGPPVLDTADLSAIQEATDGLVMVLRSGISRNRSVRAAVELVSPTPIVTALLMDA